MKHCMTKELMMPTLHENEERTKSGWAHLNDPISVKIWRLTPKLCKYPSKETQIPGHIICHSRRKRFHKCIYAEHLLKKLQIQEENFKTRHNKAIKWWGTWLNTSLSNSMQSMQKYSNIQDTHLRYNQVQRVNGWKDHSDA